MKNRADTEDLVQETFLRLIRSAPRFSSEEHEKAWLIVTASNLCKNALKHWSRRSEALEEHPELQSPDRPRVDPVLDAIFRLPPAYKTAVYLYYYEGYSTREMAELLSLPEATVRTHLVRARARLKTILTEAEPYDGQTAF